MVRSKSELREGVIMAFLGSSHSYPDGLPGRSYSRLDPALANSLDLSCKVAASIRFR